MPRRPGVPLLVLILLGLGLSGAALVSLGAFFSWLSLGTTYPWELDPRPSQEEQFGIVRNAVTAGAALGLGITLLLSYRRQKTNEQSQNIAARALGVSAAAQETAAEALQLANKQHGLDVERRHDDAIRELHARYGRAAEQLAHSEVAVRLAGVYATAALADDWNFHREEDQRQACLDLLCSYYRIPARDVDRQEWDLPVREAIWSTVMSRLAADCPESKSWASALFDFRSLRDAPQLVAGVVLRNNHLDFSKSNFPNGLIVDGCELRGGMFDLSGIKSPLRPVTLQELRLLDGHFYADFHVESPVKTMKFQACDFVGGRLAIWPGVEQVYFTKCNFKGSELDVQMAWGLKKAEFVDCEFQTDVVEQPPNQRDFSTWLRGADLVFRGCSFSDGVPVLSSRQGDEAVHAVAGAG